MEFPEELKYTEEHEWVLVEDTIITIGITDFAQDSLGDVVFVELPEVGAEVVAGKSFGVVESVKAVSDIYAPVSGEVVEINEELPETPELINTSPYEDGWMIKVRINDPADLADLMDADAYQAFVEEEE
ncbi:MAG: glycine cleavage system protein GcvH [Desulfuromonadales bacterium]|uniref:glycine cleavage system protein GcvH n=1 Tax=Desulfuromonas sp. KJ2020 TaxID=2919173 RepID=UPI0003210BA8|nr:glycine cleavage system protein GcvH [Desulfuromonas sp. KJ2020]MCP3176929.1 glycine cleavage system protein GcvH [Desulfuromonas sp. KJ2020]